MEASAMTIPVSEGDGCSSCGSPLDSFRQFPLVRILGVSFTNPKDIPDEIQGQELDSNAVKGNLTGEHRGSETKKEGDLIKHLSSLDSDGLEPFGETTTITTYANLSRPVKESMAEGTPLARYRDRLRKKVGGTFRPRDLFPKWKGAKSDAPYWEVPRSNILNVKRGELYLELKERDIRAEKRTTGLYLFFDKYVDSVSQQHVPTPIATFGIIEYVGLVRPVSARGGGRY